MSALVQLRTGAAAPAPATSPAAHADFRVVHSRVGQHLFVVDGSRLFDLGPDVASAITAALAHEHPQGELVLERLRRRFTGERPRIDGRPLEPPPLRSLSLNVAQHCNLACGYCYADEGRFGGHAALMSPEIARAAVDRLLEEAEAGVDVVVGFMGGEPLLARALVHETTAYAVRQAERTGHRVRFSLTTNATRVTDEDAALFEHHRFSVSVSLDGPRALNDALRPTHRGGGSYAEALAGLERLAARRPGHLSARITVTPRSGPLRPILDHVIGLGFDDAGFAPVLVSPDPALAFASLDMEAFLGEMIRCGETARAHLLAGRRYPFTNFETALNEIHRGSHRPHPCGAGAAYLSVAADGGLYACHRLVEDRDFVMGSVTQGSDLDARARHLASRHVDRAEPCRRCWARYLCGGGCYHEVERRGRVACDYIRGWLEFCLRSYAELSERCPEYFVDPDAHFANAEERA